MSKEKNTKENELLHALKQYQETIGLSLDEDEKELYQDYVNGDITSDKYKVVSTHEVMGRTYHEIKRKDKTKKEDTSITRIQEKIKQMNKEQ